MTTERIRTLNDQFRTGAIAGNNPGAASLGTIVTTRSIAMLDPEDYFAILGKVAGFSDFNAGNDPHGEHDYGSFEHNGETIIWKISYYDRNSFGKGPDMGSEDPADPAVTYRVLTVMLASEY